LGCTEKEKLVLDNLFGKETVFGTTARIWTELNIMDCGAWEYLLDWYTPPEGVTSEDVQEMDIPDLHYSLCRLLDTDEFKDSTWSHSAEG
jgi:hypothetical protein